MESTNAVMLLYNTTLCSQFKQTCNEIYSELAVPHPLHLTSLDLFRSFAALSVIWFHSSREWANMTGVNDLLTQFPVVSNGWRGVDLFFVLSGYLIGRQLLREVNSTGKVNLFQFMVIRRGLRIWPLYYSILLIWCLALKDTVFSLYNIKIWSDILFVSNYIGDGILPQAWSLCVEEQFYLLAPLILILLKNQGSKNDLVRMRYFLLAFLLFEPIIRAIVIEYCRDGASSIEEIFTKHLYRPLHTHADGLLAGLLIANVLEEYKKVSLRTSCFAILGSLVLLCVSRRYSQIVFDSSVSAMLSGSIICFALSMPNIPRISVVRRTSYLLAKLSFGMYLNHPLIIHLTRTWISNDMVPDERVSLFLNICYGILITLSSFILALITYVTIEYPALRLRDYFLHSR